MDKDFWLSLIAKGQISEVLDEFSQFSNKPYSKEIIEKSVRIAAVECPDIAFKYINLYKTETYAGQVIEEAARNAAEYDPITALFNRDLYKDTSYAEVVLKKAAYAAAEKDPRSILWDEDFYKRKPYGQDVINKAVNAAAEQDPATIFDKIQNSSKNIYPNEVIKKAAYSAAENEPGIVLYYFSLFKDRPYAREVLEKAVRNSAQSNPESLFTMAKPAPYLDQPYSKEVLLTAADKAPLAALTAYEFYKDKPYAKELTSRAARDVFKDKSEVLELLERFNAQHHLPNEVRFVILQTLSPGQKYDLITKGREEAYTSTYLTIVDSLFVDLQKSHQPIDKLLSSDQMQNMGVFLEAAASYNRINQALANISPDKLAAILHSLTQQCSDGTHGMEAVATLATIITAHAQNTHLRLAIEKELHEGYEQGITDKAIRHRFGLLSALYANNYATAIAPNEQQFFIKMKDAPLYKLPAINELDKSQLTDGQGSCNQLMVFAADDDGKNSYNHWKEQYKNQNGWQTFEYDNYTVIQKTDGKVPIFIYANKPEAGMEAVKEIDGIVSKRQGLENPSYQVFIGRGHSYHADEYLQYLRSNPGLVCLGSCGGYKNLSKVLQIDPKTQVISTKERGSMYINDPLLFNLNKSINSTGQIIWKEQERLLQLNGSVDKNGYVLPDKNIGLKILEYYNEIKDEPTVVFDTLHSLSNPIFIKQKNTLRL